MSEFTNEFRGAVFLDKRIVQTEWFTGCSPTTVCLMFYFILAANFEAKEWKKGVLVKRGEFICSLNTLADKTNLAASTLKDSIKRLSELGEIEVTSKSGNNGYHHIRVVHYDRYTCANLKPEKASEPKTDKKGGKKSTSKAKEEVTEESEFTAEEVNNMFPD